MKRHKVPLAEIGNPMPFTTPMVATWIQEEREERERQQRQTLSPTGTQPGSLEWMQAAAGLAKSWAKRCERDVRELVKYVTKLQQHDCSVLASNWDRVCREVLGQEPAFIAAMIEGARIIDPETDALNDMLLELAAEELDAETR